MDKDLVLKDSEIVNLKAQLKQAHCQHEDLKKDFEKVAAHKDQEIASLTDLLLFARNSADEAAANASKAAALAAEESSIAAQNARK